MADVEDVRRVAGLDDKDALLAEHPHELFTESHRLTLEHEARKRPRRRRSS